MAPYKKVEDFDATTFEVLPNPFDTSYGIGKLIFQGIVCMLFVSGCTAAGVAGGGGGGALIALGGLAFFSLMYVVPHRRIMRERRTLEAERAPTSIVVTSTHLTAKGQEIPYSNLHRLMVKNKYRDMPARGGSTFVGAAYGSAPVVAASMATTAALGAAANIARNLEAKRFGEVVAVSFELYAEAGGVAYALVQGLNETAAHGLMVDL